MSASFLRKPWAWVLIGVAALIILFTLLPGGSDNVDRPLTVFIEEVRAGNVQRVEVDDAVLEYKLIGDDQTFETRMEEGDTLREVLQDSGIAPEDFPPITIKEPSFWSNLPGLLIQFLPIIFITGILYFFLRAARGGVTTKEKDRDPVCGKRVGAGNAAGISTFQDVSYRFCSAECKQQFDTDPVRYLLHR
jgi:YHS domain-containing protein